MDEETKQVLQKICHILLYLATGDGRGAREELTDLRWDHGWIDE